jgi:hypothetical protein
MKDKKVVLAFSLHPFPVLTLADKTGRKREPSLKLIEQNTATINAFDRIRCKNCQLMVEVGYIYLTYLR